jgi:hypothetical protein
MAHHEHEHDHEHEGHYGMALGFRIFESDGKLFFAEAEITPYVDEPNALGATIVFHPLSGLDPTDPEGEAEWPAWPVDIDDDLTRDTGAPMPAQFESIARQLGSLTEAQLRDYLQQAMEESEAE